MPKEACALQAQRRRTEDVQSSGMFPVVTRFSQRKKQEKMKKLVR